MSTPCIVLAGGLGTRLRSVLPDTPKCLAPIDGVPFLRLQMLWLQRQGVSRFVLSLGHGSEQVREAAEQWRADFDIDCVTEDEPLGTGGAIRLSMTTLGLSEALAINGDTFAGGDLAGMQAPLRTEQGELIRMGAVHVDNRQRFGGLSISPEGRVTQFIEKGDPTGGPINAGLYRIHVDAFAAMQGEASFSFEDRVLRPLSSTGQVYAMGLSGPFIDIGVPEDYALMCRTYREFGLDAH